MSADASTALGPATVVTAGARRPVRAAAYRWELRRLLLQNRVRLLLLLAVVAPLLLVAALEVQSAVPADTLFGRHVKDSGWAVTLVVLGFVGQWGIPAVVGLIAGDIFSAEDRHGSWWLLLARSRGRGQFVRAKTLAAVTVSLAVVVLLAVVSVAAGLLFIGTQPLLDLGGVAVSGGDALGRVAAAWLSIVPPTLAFVALALLVSAAARNGIVGVFAPLVVGLALQLVELVNLPVPLRLALPSAGFDAWHGFFTRPTFTGPFGWGVVAGLVWAAVLLAVAAGIVTRRDISGSAS